MAEFFGDFTNKRILASLINFDWSFESKAVSELNLPISADHQSSNFDFPSHIFCL